MMYNRAIEIVLFALVCHMNIKGSCSNPLQHLSEIDLSYGDMMGRASSLDSEPTSMTETEGDSIESDSSKLVTTAQVSPIVTGLLNTMGNSLGPLLGPLAPLSTIIGPMVNNAVTDLVTNAINGLLGSLNKDALGQMNGYESYVINIPNQGSFLLLSKPSQVSSYPIHSDSSNTLNNFIAAPSAMPSVAAIPVTNTLLDNLKGVGHMANINKPISIVSAFGGHAHKKKFKRKPQNFLIPLNHIKLANGNLNSFTRSRSSSPLTDYELEVY